MYRRYKPTTAQVLRAYAQQSPRFNARILMAFIKAYPVHAAALRKAGAAQLLHEAGQPPSPARPR